MPQLMAVLKDDAQSPYTDDLTFIRRVMAEGAEETVREAVEGNGTQTSPAIADGEEFRVWTGVDEEDETTVTYWMESAE